MEKAKQAKNEDRMIHVFLVDDDTNLVRITKQLFERMGYIVTSANGSTEALTLIEKYHDEIDVVITDYSMPVMNGIEFALRARKILFDTPFILYTGRIDLIDKKQIDEANISEVVRKPCKIKDLDILIRKILSIHVKR